MGVRLGPSSGHPSDAQLPTRGVSALCSPRASYRHYSTIVCGVQHEAGVGRYVPSASASRLRAYNLGNFIRTLAMPKTAEPWSLTSLGEKLIKIGAKVASQGCCVTFQITEVVVPRQLFAEILMLIARLRVPPTLA